MVDTISILQPDDWHVHVREGALMCAVLPYTAKVFGRAVIMPNLKPPVTTTAQAEAYRNEILAALPPKSPFVPLMTLYLTETTDPDDIERGFAQGIVRSVKLYPANVTTNAALGVARMGPIAPVLERMQKLGMSLSIHGEVSDSAIDAYDREAVFIERELIPLRRDFPELKIVLEHATTEEAVAYVLEEGKGGRLASTITAHHLHINRNEMFMGGLRPHNYCLPLPKREKHRLALVKAATSGAPMFFLGTDSAPHPETAKESACGCAGIFTAMNALALYAHIFDGAGRLDAFEAFASRNGPAFYGLPLNEGRITLKKDNFQEIKPILTQDKQKIVPFVPPSPLMWHVVD